jgi:hypothetical protein
VFGEQRFDAGRRGNQTHECDLLGVAFFEQMQRGRTGVAGREHRVEHVNVAAFEALRHVGVVRYRFERRRVAIKAEMRDLGIFDHREKSRQEAEARTQDRRDDRAPADAPRLRRLERRQHDRFDGRQRARGLVGQIQADLFH